MDTDLAAMTLDEARAEAQRLRNAIRAHHSARSDGLTYFMVSEVEYRWIECHPFHAIRVRRPVADPPEGRWNHLGGLRFCRGEHPKNDACDAHAFELPCPWGTVGSVVAIVRESLEPTKCRRTLSAITLDKTEGVMIWILTLYPTTDSP